MQDTLIQAQRQLGLTSLSTLRECKPASPLSKQGINLLLSKRVFVLGPSHHVYMPGCALSSCKEFETPIGNLPLDLESTSNAIQPDHSV